MTPTTASESLIQSGTQCQIARRGATSGAAGTVAGIILAGSYRSRERDFAGLIPRPLVPVAQVPIVAYAMRWFRESDLRTVKVCSNGHAQSIRTCVAAAAPLMPPVDYVEDHTPRGPAGCARDAAMATDADTFLVVDASVIPLLDFNALIDAHARSGAALTTVVYEQPHLRQTSAPVVTPAGIYLFSRRALEAVSKAGFQDIKEHLIPALRRRHERVCAYVADEISPRVINAETYLAVNHWAIARIPQNPAMLEGRNITISGEVVSHPGVHVHDCARIVGPVILGAGVTIAAGATIIGPASIGAGTRIGEDAVVSRSVLWNDCVIERDCFVDHAVVATGVNIAPGRVVERAVKRRADAPRRFNWRDALKPHGVAAQRPSVVDVATP